jgi:hypothetical protein
MVLNMEMTELPNQEDTTGTYWNNNNNKKNARPKFTYDDILSSLNLEVSNNGVLQRMTIKTDANNNNTNNNNTNTNNNNTNNNSNPNVKQIKTINNTRVEPEVKHSYIYNKYFKNYKEANGEIIAPRIPKTREEYRQMVIEDLINRQKAKQRIAQIKSTKMLYTNNNNFYAGTPIHVNRNNLNRLFRIK